jgi:hypothetical protein
MYRLLTTAEVALPLLVAAAAAPAVALSLAVILTTASVQAF